MSKGTWIKPAGKVYAPSRWVSVVVTPRTVGREGGAAGAWSVFRSAAVLAAECRRGTWRRIATTAHTSPSAALAQVELLAQDRRATWVVSPDATASLTLLGAWDVWDKGDVVWAGREPLPDRSPVSGPARPGSSRGAKAGRIAPPGGPPERPDTISVHTLITRGNPTIVKYSRGNRRLTWVSASQYTPATAADVARSLGVAPPGPADRDDAGFLPDDDGAWLAGVWLSYMCELSDWWRAVGGGPWSATAGGLGMSFVRKRIAPKSILSHTDDCARGLEERALYGGRAAVWCVAPVGPDAPPPACLGPAATVQSYRPVPGPVELWDVRSMYPTILGTQDFPVRYVGIVDAPPPALLLSAMKDYLVIADVILTPDRGEYPYRDGEQLRFPTGQFRTCLPDPELRRALEAGAVARVIRAATYRRGRPFALPAAELVALRRAAEAEGNGVRAGFVKMLSNAYSGKMAQRKHDWARKPDVAPLRRWGEWPVLDADTGAVRRFRAAAGLVWERQPHKHGGRPLGACYAMLTSYGRCLMRTVREMLPARSVVSQDTDGVWVVGEARDRFNAVAQALLSIGYSITRKSVSPSGRWLGPRHYWTAAGWVLSGFHRPNYAVASGTVSDTYSVIPPLGTSARPPSGVLTVTRESQLVALDLDGATDADGWLTPLVVRPKGNQTPV